MIEWSVQAKEQEVGARRLRGEQIGQALLAPCSRSPLGSDFFQLSLPLLLNRWSTLTGARCWEKTLRDPRQASHLATRLLLPPHDSKRCPQLAPYDANRTALDTSLTHPPSSMPQWKTQFCWYVATCEGD